MFRPRFAALGLALATLLVFFRVGRHEFITYDDPDYVTENTMVQGGLSAAGLKWAFTTFHANNWHPLTWISHMMDCALFGVDPGAHHLVNVLFHSANATLLFLLLVRLTGRSGVAFVVAGLFAWHPMHVQSVAWISERKDVLSTFFMFLAIMAYVRSRSSAVNSPSAKQSEIPTAIAPSDRGWDRAYVAALLLFALGLMAKPMLVTLSFVLVLLDYWPLRRAAFASQSEVPLSRLLVEKWPFFLLTAASCVVTFAAQRAEAVVALAPHPLPLRLANAVLSYGVYLWKLVWPVNLSVIYPLAPRLPWVSVVGSGTVLTAITVAVWKLRATKPHLLVGWLWYLGTLVPVIGLVQVGGQALADRYTYVPYIGLFIALSYEIANYLASGTERLRKVGAILTTVVLTGCIATTYMQLGFWKDSERLFSRALQVTGDNAVAQVNLGIALQARGSVQEALDLYLRAIRIHPTLVQAHHNAANLLDAAGRTEEAIEHYRQALRLKPHAALAHANLAAVLSRNGQTEEARTHFAEAARLAPRDPRVPYLMGKALLRDGLAVEAIAAFKQSLGLDPNHVQTLTFLARAVSSDEYPTVRNAGLAVELAERAAALTGSSDPFVLETLAIAYAQAGERARALQVLTAAIELTAAQGDKSGTDALEKRRRELQADQR